ncbi:importin-7 [Nematocida sp. AWRm80]|nr:importin-7 [Nematocida sp. AWRm80]
MTETNLREGVLMTLQPDIEHKKIGEKRLEEMSKIPGFLMGLLKLSEEDSEKRVRMISAVYFRRFLQRFWAIDGFDKKTITDNFPSFILRASADGEKQLLTALEFILKTEEASEWSSVMELAERFILSEDPKAQGVGLKILNKEIIAFQDTYKSDVLFGNIFDNVGMKILDIINSALTQNNYDRAALGMKVFARAPTGYILPNVYKVPVFVQNLINLCVISTDPRISNVSLAKWTLQLLNTLLKKTHSKQEHQTLKAIVEPEPLSMFYKRALEVYSAYHQNNESQKVMCESLLLIKSVVNTPKGWDIVKPNIQTLMNGFIIPIAAFSEEQEELWESSQIDFMRDQEARYHYSPNLIVEDIFFSIIKAHRDSPEIVDGLVTMVLQGLSVYTANPNNETAKTRYGCLCLLKSIAKYIHSNNHVLGVILQDLSAPHAIVKSIAFSAVQHFSYYRPMPQEILNPFMREVESPDLAVMVEAILCLPCILEIDELKAKVQQYIPNFIRLILDLANKVQIEALSTALEEVICICKEESISIAPAIAGAVSTSIIHLLKEGADQEEEADEKFQVIDGYVRTLIALIESLEKSPEIMGLLMPTIKDMILHVARNYSDYMPDLFPLVVTCTYTLKDVSGMYDILEEILKIPMDDLVVYFGEISSVLDNYISYGHEGMLRYLDKIFGIMTGIMDGYITDYEFPYLCRILDSIILNLANKLGNKITELYKTIFKLALGNEEMLEYPSAIMAAVETFMCAFIIAPAPAMEAIMFMNKLPYVIKETTEHYKSFERVHDLKILLLFSGFLLTQPRESIPQEIPLKLLSTLFVYSVTTIPNALAYRETLKNNGQDFTDEYYDQEFFQEDPTFETPLDSIDPYTYTREVLNSQANASIHAVWKDIPEVKQSEIIQILQNKH